MRFKFNKKIEFFLKRNFLPQSYLFKKRIERSIKNNYEAELKLVKNFITPETDSIDIGVYRGVYSYEMAKYSKFVHAFEPNPIIFKDIEINLKKIIKNIKFYNFALSNKEGLVSLKVPIRNKNYNKKNYEEYFQMGRASIHTDNIMNEIETFENKISFIKIDVEGHEFEVIKGAENTIKKNKPVLLVEIVEKHTQTKVSDTLDYINSLGYGSFYFKDNILKSTNSLNNFNLINNFIFRPV
jgi:FkbM family methyltransferase